MTEKEVEMAYKKMTESDAPDLWARIESNLPEKEIQPEDKKGNGIWGRIGQILGGGSTWKTSLAVCAFCVIIYGVTQGAGGMWTSGTSSEMMADTAAAKGGNHTEAYALEGSANDAPAEADVEAYDGMNDVAADGTTGNESVSSNGTAVMSENQALAADNSSIAETKATDDSASVDSESSRKLIRTINMNAETMNFDELLVQLQNETQTLGGYVENSYVDGSSYDAYNSNERYASLTLRIPKDKTEAFLSEIGDMANVTSRSENVEDVTLTYTDLKSHVEALQAEQEQLLKLMEQAKTVEDTMSIQSRLTDVRYELESYMSQLKVYDNQVDYDTVNMTIQEVKNETPTGELSIGQKMRNGLKDSLRTIAEGAKNVCIWFVASLPYFAILFAVIYLIIHVIKKFARRNKTMK